jgi:hypothetical protein
MEIAYICIGCASSFIGFSMQLDWFCKEFHWIYMHFDCYVHGDFSLYFATAASKSIQNSCKFNLNACKIKYKSNHNSFLHLPSLLSASVFSFVQGLASLDLQGSRHTARMHAHTARLHACTQWIGVRGICIAQPQLIGVREYGFRVLGFRFHRDFSLELHAFRHPPSLPSAEAGGLGFRV